jgi:hypothetical protein
MKKLLLCMAAILTAWCANAQLYVTGGDVEGAPASWSPENPLTVTASDGYYTFKATGDFKISTAKGGWDTDFNPNAKQLSGSWNVSGTTASASLTDGTENISAAQAGKLVTYKVNTDLTSISASWGNEAVQLDFYIAGSFNSWVVGEDAYKFQTTDYKTYTLDLPDGVDLDTSVFGWKITTIGWSVNFGMTDGDEPVFGTEYTLVPSGVNITTELPAGTHLKFTYDGNQGGKLLLTNGSSQGGGEITASDLVVIGSFNEWDATDLTTYKMTQNGDTYTYTFSSLPADTEFKIKEAVAGWETAQSWGAEGDISWAEAQPIDVTVGTAMNAWPGSGCNFKLTEALTNAKLTFTLSHDADVASTLLVTSDSSQGGGDDPIVTPASDFVLIGSFNEWDVTDVTTYKMVAAGNNTYTYEMALPAGTEFKVKVAEANWNCADWGAEGDPSASVSGPVAVTVGDVMNAWSGSSCNFYVSETIASAKITFTYESDLELPSSILVTRQESGVEAVAADANAAAVYYNLQGIRVMQPVAGQIYIMNRAGKVSKVLYR